jgi:hypothetical protein
MTIEELKAAASAVAQELQAMGDAPVDGTLRDRFITVRAELFQRGVYDPVLVRFDSATVAQASTREVAEELAAVASTLR